MAIPGPFSWTNTLTLTPTPFTSAQLTKLRGAVQGFDQMGVALVDIGNTTNMAYALNFTKTAFAASLPKIVAMYAAFYLQDRLKAIKPFLGAASLAQIEAKLRQEWGPAIKATVPRRAGDFPDITAIFASTNFDFKASFKKDLNGMMKKSDNWAAGSCIHRIGYDYINGALIHGGFYSTTDKSGFWLAGDYIPDDHKSNREGARIPGMGTSQAASAKAAALLLVNLARDELISAEASQGMKDVMSEAYSWVRYQMERTHPEATVYGKLGLMKGKHGSTHDCAIVKHNNAHYVVIALFGGYIDLEPLFIELDIIAQQLFSVRKILELGLSLFSVRG
ncbi:MAG: serine hydrolase [Candidatus Competibacteraceae bacterium]|nr:serine hydrolase [Candidatus Competibacteraceae bacterium]